MLRAKALADPRFSKSRYVLKNRDTGDVFFVVVFTLVPKEDTERKDAKEKTSAESKGKDGKTDDTYEPKDDDVD